MDAAPRGLAPGGPGATGAPLLDWILCDPGLAASLLSHLAPRDVLGLRASCKAACAAVAAPPWESAAVRAWSHSYFVPPPLDVSVRAAAESSGDFVGLVSSHLTPPYTDVFGGRAALARWRACFPRARSVVVSDICRQDDPGEVTDGGVAALAAVAGSGSQLTRLGLRRCDGLAGAALAACTRLTSLAVTDTALTGACWAGLAGRLRSVTTDATGPVTDAHLPALARCTHVSLGMGAAVSDAGVAAHLSRQVTHLSLDVSRCAGFDGSGLRSATRLVGLRLTTGEEVDPTGVLVPDALAGCAAGLTSLELQGVDGGDALFAAGGGGLPALRRATLRWLPALTDAAFARTTPALGELVVDLCERFVGGADLGPLPGLASLDVDVCGAFTGRGLTAGRTPALRWLAVRRCDRFAEADGGGGDADSAQSGQSAEAAAPALPLLAGVHVEMAPCPPAAWFSHAPRLTHLVLDACVFVAGRAPDTAARLPAVTHLAATQVPSAQLSALLGLTPALRQLAVRQSYDFEGEPGLGTPPTGPGVPDGGVVRLLHRRVPGRPARAAPPGDGRVPARAAGCAGRCRGTMSSTSGGVLQRRRLAALGKLAAPRQQRRGSVAAGAAIGAGHGVGGGPHEARAPHACAEQRDRLDRGPHAWCGQHDRLDRHAGPGCCSWRGRGQRR
jgi:hypothetical protein